MSTMKKLLECISDLAEEKLNLLLEYVLQLLPAEEERPCCPHCGNAYIIKYGRKDGKQRFQCKKCLKSFMLTTNTIAAESHQPLSVWRQFVADTLHLRPIDDSAQELGLSHQCAFHMRHKMISLSKALDGRPHTRQMASDHCKTMDFFAQSPSNTPLFTSYSGKKGRLRPLTPLMAE